MAIVSLIPDNTTLNLTVVDADAASLGINLGAVLKFTVAGSITALRFYEKSDLAGTVDLRLYSSAGAVLASVQFTAVSGQSGWRNVALATPYAITIGTWYMTAYHTPSGATGSVYATIPSLTYDVERQSAAGEIVSAVDGVVTFSGNTGNGRYLYGALGLPPNTFGSANYTADVVFDTGGGTTAKTAVESTLLSESVSLLQARATTETTILTESSSLLTTDAKSASDSTIFSETSSLAQTNFVSTTETTALSENTSISAVGNASDTTVQTGTTTLLRDSFGNDSSLLSEIASTTQTEFKSAVEATTFTEASSLLISDAKSANDSIAQTDATGGLLMTFNGSDAAIQAEGTSALTNTISTNDPSSQTESPSIVSSLSSFDSSILNDSGLLTQLGFKTASDSGTYTDSGAVSIIPADAITFNWSGRTWTVKTGNALGPGPNNWRNENAVLDGSDLLLKIDQSAGIWYCGEVVSTDAPGYGEYTWVVDYDPTVMDIKPVLGLFTWDTGADPREIDIEITKWNWEAEKSRIWYTVQPTTEQRRAQYPASPLGATAKPYTCTFIWQANGVYFKTTDASGKLIGEDWVTDVPFVPGNANVRMNLWLVLGNPPVNGQPLTVRLKSFKHTVGINLPTRLPAKEYVQEPFEGYRLAIKEVAEIRFGSLILPTTGGYLAEAFTGHIINLQDSDCFIELEEIPQSGVGHELTYEMRFDNMANRALFIATGSGGSASVICRWVVGGVTTGADVSFVLGNITNKYWRFREAAGTLYWESSIDGTTWTIRRQVIHNLTFDRLSRAVLYLNSGNWNTEAPANYTIKRINKPIVVIPVERIYNQLGLTSYRGTALGIINKAVNSMAAKQVNPAVVLPFRKEYTN